MNYRLFLSVFVFALVFAISGAVFLHNKAIPAKAGTFTVTNTADDGLGSLRQAIVNANGSPGKDTIEFQIPGPGPHTIGSLTKKFDALTEAVTIDATSAGACDGSEPNIVIDGTGLIDAADHALEITVGTSTVRGLVIINFGGHGIYLNNADSNTIECNYLGVSQDGITMANNGATLGSDLQIENSDNNQIGGTNPHASNYFSHVTALSAETANNNVIQNNVFGYQTDRSTLLGGIVSSFVIQILDGANNRIEGNQIRQGLTITGAPSTGNSVMGNLFGLQAMEQPQPHVLERLQFKMEHPQIQLVAHKHRGAIQ